MHQSYSVLMPIKIIKASQNIYSPVVAVVVVVDGLVTVEVEGPVVVESVTVVVDSVKNVIHKEHFLHLES